jgi:hypothetical protein
MNAESDFEHAKQQFAKHLKSLTFAGMIVTGRNRLVSIDLARAKMMVRKASKQKPFCHINLPTKSGPGCDVAMSEALMHPKLEGNLSLDAIDDLTATLWAYVSIRLIEHPIDFRQIKLSPEFYAS